MSRRVMAASFLSSIVVMSTVSCGLEIVGVGLTATRITRSSPLLMPPRNPPQLLVRKRTLPSSRNGWSFHSLPSDAGGLEAGAELQARHRADAAQAVGDGGLELVEHRLAQPGRHAAGDDLDRPAGRVARLADLQQVGDHLRRGLQVAAVQVVLAVVGLHLLEGHRAVGDRCGP